MLIVPEIYMDKNAKYLTEPVIKSFMSEHDIPYSSSAVRSEWLTCIINFGNESDSNKATVLNWIDDVALEGIREIHVKYFPIKQESKALLENEEYALSQLKKHIPDEVVPHLSSNVYDEKLTLVSVRWMGEGRGRKIVFTYCKKLFTYESSRSGETTKPIDYPIIAEYYIYDQWLLVIAKSRSPLYLERPNRNGESKRTTTEKQIDEVFNEMESILFKDNSISTRTETKLKNKLYRLINEYTGTPSEIKEIMESSVVQMDTIKEMIADLCHVQGKCNPPSSEKIQNDIANIVEKHLSINWHDNRIFTQGRKAYPIMLNSIDGEETKLKQETSIDLPLQKQSAFFNNKNTLNDKQSCNSAIFAWKRANPWYSTQTRFPVEIYVKKEVCVFKFTKYTKKEDMDDVIFSVIGADENTDKP